MREELPLAQRQQSVEGQSVHWRLNIQVIERARILRGWTKADLARVAHLDPGTLCDMTLGRRRPGFGTVQAVCVALGLVLSDVIVFGDAAAA